MVVTYPYSVMRTIKSVALLIGLSVVSVLFLTNIVGAEESTFFSEQNVNFLVHDRESIESLFEAIDWSRKELAGVESAWKSGDRRSAVIALAEYYRKRGIDKEMLPEITQIEGIAGQRAEDALKNIHWAQDVYGALPAGKLSLYDWEHKGPNNDVEWAWFLNRHTVFSDMYAKWLQEPNSDYPRKVSSLVSDWVRHNPVPRFMSFSSAWRALEAARRIETPWVEVFFRMADVAEFSLEARILMLSSIHEHGDYLMAHHAFRGNHKITEMMALMLIALAWPEFKSSQQWLDYAVDQLKEELFSQTYPDGVHKELSNHYQRVTLFSFQRALHLLEAGGRMDKYVLMRPRVEAMWDYFALVMAPNGNGPVNNDSGNESNANWMMAYCLNEYNRPDWVYLINSLYAKVEGAVAIQPEGYPSRYFPWAGHAIMRQNWGRESGWAFFDIGPYGTDHQHNDRLHLSVSVGRRDFLVDSGRFTYQPGNVRDYYKGADGHNVVTLNGKSAQTGPLSVTEPMPVIADIGNDRDVFEACVYFDSQPLIGKGRPEHRRRVEYFKNGYKSGYWIVSDTLKNFGFGKWETLWHFHPQCKLLIEGVNVRTTFDKGVNLALIPVNFEPDIRLLRGATAPKHQGWYSARFNQQEPAPVVIYETLARSPRQQVTLILPFADGDTVPEVEWFPPDTVGIRWVDGHTATHKIR